MYRFGKISIICVGGLKEAYLRDAQEEFLKRLSPYGKLAVLEVKDEGKIAGRWAFGSYKIALSVDGARFSSEELASHLGKLAVDGHSHLEFIIGGSEGLPAEILKSCHLRLSLSPMTFTHQMARIILLEQLYRACRILNNEPYHK
jgi:23S rRNA (pseudouridine1915-N3)-methyltransferase